jgi:ribosome-associated protein
MMTFCKHYRESEVKGNDIDILDLREIDSAVCDYFVICNGNSNTLLNVNLIQKVVLKEIKDKPCMLKDLTMCAYGWTKHIVVHVFQNKLENITTSKVGDAKLPQ